MRVVSNDFVKSSLSMLADATIQELPDLTKSRGLPGPHSPKKWLEAKRTCIYNEIIETNGETPKNTSDHECPLAPNL